VHLASQTLTHAPLTASTTAARMSGGAPGGTIASIFAITEDVPAHLLARAKCDWSLSPVLGARSPARRFVYSLGSRRGALAPFGAINRSLVQRTAGLLRLAHLECDRKPANVAELPPNYGPAFTYTEFMLTAGAVSAFLVSFAMVAAFVGITSIAPVRRAASRSGHHLLLHLCFTDPVAGQASGNAARIGARRPVSASLLPGWP
jgi:hypothetical protein